MESQGKQADRVEKTWQTDRVRNEKIGIWKAELTSSGIFSDPFGGTELKFEEWLQLVFLPKLFSVGNLQPFPPKSTPHSLACPRKIPF